MVKTPYIDENGLKKGAWSPEEDQKLRSYIQRYGYWNWRELPKYAGLARCGKSCRLRWINYLQPNVKHGDYTKEEEELIIKLHEQLGNRWSAMARKLPGRTDNEIKNHWHTHLKKRVQEHQHKTKKGRNRKFTEKSWSNEPQISKNTTILEYRNQKINQPVQILESCPIYPSSPQRCFSSESSPFSTETLSSIINDNNHNDGPTLSNSYLGSGSCSDSEGVYSSWDTLGELVDESFWNEPFILENSQEIEFNFLDEVMLSPYMSSRENMELLISFP